MVLSMDRWFGKVAIVTDAVSEVGEAICKMLLDNGMQVVGVGKTVEDVQERIDAWGEKKGKMYPAAGDFTKEDDILKVFSWVHTMVGQVHILINNAGVSRKGTLLKASTPLLKETLDLNVLGLAVATREALRVMIAFKIKGHIVNLGSVASHRVPNIPDINIYPATQYARRAFTETLRQELARDKHKIKVTEINPGGVLCEKARRLGQSPEHREFVAKFPLLLAEDVADGVSYVLSTPEHVQVHELLIKPLGESI